MDRDEDDVTLITAIADGDRDALACLYDRYAPTLLGLAHRILGGPRDAEDLLHNVFLEAWRAAADYDPARGSVRSWLTLRLRSRAIDRLREVGVARAVALDGEAAATDPASDADPSLGPDRAVVRRALDALPEEQRRAVELAYFEGLSATEIAARMSVPVGTVKSRLAAGLARLRGELKVSKVSVE